MNKKTGTTHVPLHEITDDNIKSESPQLSDEERSLQHEGPNLHMLGTLFLGNISRVIFDIAVLLHLCVSV